MGDVWLFAFGAEVNPSLSTVKDSGTKISKRRDSTMRNAVNGTDDQNLDFQVWEQ